MSFYILWNEIQNFCCIISTTIHLLYDWFQKWVKALESRRTEKQNDLNEQFTSLHTGSCCPLSLCRRYPPWCCCSSRQSCGPLPVKYLTHTQISPNSDVFWNVNSPPCSRQHSIPRHRYYWCQSSPDSCTCWTHQSIYAWGCSWPWTCRSGPQESCGQGLIQAPNRCRNLNKKKHFPTPPNLTTCFLFAFSLVFVFQPMVIIFARIYGWNTLLVLFAKIYIQGDLVFSSPKFEKATFVLWSRWLHIAHWYFGFPPLDTIPLDLTLEDKRELANFGLVSLGAFQGRIWRLDCYPFADITFFT